MASIQLTWLQFEEILKNMQAVHQAHALDADEGEVKNTVIDSEWNDNGVKITLDLD
uniref:Uncharacterized protein n=1 Tax=viral metagenome TaxID=1070528 RepID=A0A6M3J4S0_9ZZZZ